MDLDGAPRVGMVGGGQLARMSAAPAAALGIGLRVLASDPGESAAQVIHDVALGRHDDLGALKRFAAGCDVVTFDHEHVPPAHLEQLEAMGVAVRPGPAALFHAQDKVHMRQSLTDIGVRCPRWRVVATVDDVAEFAARCRLAARPEDLARRIRRPRRVDRRLDRLRRRRSSPARWPPGRSGWPRSASTSFRSCPHRSPDHRTGRRWRIRWFAPSR